MSVQCPAAGCGYTGHLDAVEGHIGGVADALHEGVVTADLRTPDGKASDGLMLGLLALLLVAGAAVYLSSEEPGEEAESGDSEPSEGLEEGGEW